jgi:hypothetical protein
MSKMQLWLVDVRLNMNHLAGLFFKHTTICLISIAPEFSVSNNNQFRVIMIPDHHPIVQALLAGFFTWGVTALGAAMVYVIPSNSKKFLG